MALGGAEERQDVQKNPEEGREARSAAGKQRANSQELEKGGEGVDTRLEAGAKTTKKLRPARKFQAGAGNARESPAREPGGGSGLGEGSRKLRGDWGSRPRPRLPHSPLRESPSAALCPQVPGYPNSLDRSSRPQLPGIRLLSRPKRAPPHPPISSQAERPGDWAHAFPSLSSRLLPIRCCGGPALRPGLGLMGLVVREDSGAEAGPWAGPWMGRWAGRL